MKQNMKSIMILAVLAVFGISTSKPENRHPTMTVATGVTVQ